MLADTHTNTSRSAITAKTTALKQFNEEICDNNHLVSKVTKHTISGGQWNLKTQIKYQGLTQMILNSVEDNFSYLRGRKMAERKKEAETRWIVGYGVLSKSKDGSIPPFKNKPIKREINKHI